MVFYQLCHLSLAVNPFLSLAIPEKYLIPENFLFMCEQCKKKVSIKRRRKTLISSLFLLPTLSASRPHFLVSYSSLEQEQSKYNVLCKVMFKDSIHPLCFGIRRESLTPWHMVEIISSVYLVGNLITQMDCRIVWVPDQSSCALTKCRSNRGLFGLPVHHIVRGGTIPNFFWPGWF